MCPRLDPGPYLKRDANRWRRNMPQNDAPGAPSRRTVRRWDGGVRLHTRWNPERCQDGPRNRDASVRLAKVRGSGGTPAERFDLRYSTTDQTYGPARGASL